MLIEVVIQPDHQRTRNRTPVHIDDVISKNTKAWGDSQKHRTFTERSIDLMFLNKSHELPDEIQLITVSDVVTVKDLNKGLLTLFVEQTIVRRAFNHSGDSAPNMTVLRLDHSK